MVEISYCKENEEKSTDFLKKTRNFTGDNFRLVITWKQEKYKHCFLLRTKTLYPSRKT